MTEKDKQLIKKAESMHFREWYAVDEMIEEAESAECKLKLHDIAVKYYHKEEAKAGLL